jgi:dolichol-phosphate mannosyltransferase
MGKTKSIKLSIVLPTYNEAENIKELIPQIKKEFPDSDIIVVDDNSPDGTAEIVKKLGVRVIVRKKRDGLGVALADGYNNAKGDIIVSMDADCSISVNEIHRLLEKLKEGYDLVVGSKYSRGSCAEGVGSTKKKLISLWGNRLIISFFKLPVDDVTLNFRAFSRDVWKKLNLFEKTNLFLLEMLVDAQSKNMKIAQIPATFSKRKYGKSKTNLSNLIPLYLKYLIRYIFKWIKD